ncbi:MAG TPA: hypothetical protein VK590_12495 [Saprospiraceae bacterium]|nr:hypothetical protein [Saprospiraceae bacterium]
MNNKLFFLLFNLLLLVNVSSAQVKSFYYQDKNLPCLDKKFTIAVHFVKDSTGDTFVSEDSLLAYIGVVNKLFKPICASFELCSIDTLSYYEYDFISDEKENSKMQKIFNKKFRINLYVVNHVKKSLPEFCGLATFKGITHMFDGDIIAEKKCTNGLFMCHIFGHYFGLQHTSFNTNTELVNGSNCTTAGDKICDTPADPYDPYEPVLENLPFINVKTCTFISKKKDANGEYYRPDVGNIMSLYKECFCGFSSGQYRLMAENYLNAPIKMW